MQYLPGLTAVQATFKNSDVDGLGQGRRRAAGSDSLTAVGQVSGVAGRLAPFTLSGRNKLDGRSGTDKRGLSEMAQNAAMRVVIAVLVGAVGKRNRYQQQAQY